jgi:chaperonin GroES
MKLRPTGDRVVIRRMEPETRTTGGILLPDNAQEKATIGLVVGVGPGARDGDGDYMALDIEAGDRVLFSKWGGIEIRIDGEDLVILREDDILGVLP